MGHIPGHAFSFEYGFIANLANNRNRNCFYVDQDILISKSYHLPTFRFQKRLSLEVLFVSPNPLPQIIRGQTEGDG